MALMNCPECDLQVSDKALFCPHCGFPLNGTKEQKRRYIPRRMRLPNGFGSITEIKGRHLRNPFRVRVCVGKTQQGKPILRALKPKSMFRTYNEAYSALAEYNRNPYDLDNDLTVQELYDKWTESYFTTCSEAYQRTVTSAWAYCSSIYDMRSKDVRARHLKGCMEEGFRIEYRGKHKGEKIYASAGTKSRIKSLFNLMFDYALEFEIVDRNYARTFEISDDVVKEDILEKISHNLFAAVKINGKFKHMHVRVAPKQEKPYPRFVEIARNQPEFEADNISGTIVGFFTPRLFHGAAAAGFHLHFISDDRKFGGHVLDFKLSDGTVDLMELAEFRQHFPTENADYLSNEIKLDEISKDIEEAE